MEQGRCESRNWAGSRANGEGSGAEGRGQRNGGDGGRSQVGPKGMGLASANLGQARYKPVYRAKAAHAACSRSAR